MDAQLKKGLLEVCVLVALQSSDSYGYQIIKDVSPIVEISEDGSFFVTKIPDVMKAYRYIAASQEEGAMEEMGRKEERV